MLHRTQYINMKYHGIHFDQEKIAAFCRKHGITRLSIFGSILRDDFGPHSDIDGEQVARHARTQYAA